jgi:hypothetical protein
VPIPSIPAIGAELHVSAIMPGWRRIDFIEIRITYMNNYNIVLLAVHEPGAPSNLGLILEHITILAEILILSIKGAGI